MCDLFLGYMYLNIFDKNVIFKFKALFLYLFEYTKIHSNMTKTYTFYLFNPTRSIYTDQFSIS